MLTNIIAIYSRNGWKMNSEPKITDLNDKPDSYFGGVRDDMLQYIPKQSKKFWR